MQAVTDRFTDRSTATSLMPNGVHMHKNEYKVGLNDTFNKLMMYNTAGWQSTCLQVKSSRATDLLGFTLGFGLSYTKAIESFHMKCQRRILGIRWHDFVRNSEASLRTGLAPVSDRITRGRNAIFGHVARMSDNTPAHQAMLRQVELSVGRLPDPSWKRPPGRPRTLWTDQLCRLSGGKPLVAVTRERHYGPSRLRVNDDVELGVTAAVRLAWGRVECKP